MTDAEAAMWSKARELDAEAVAARKSPGPWYFWLGAETEYCQERFSFLHALANTWRAAACLLRSAPDSST